MDHVFAIAVREDVIARATFQVVVATCWSPTRRSTSSASAFANRRTSGNASSGRIGERMCIPVAPEVFG